MNLNVGSLDRTVRIVLGLALIALAATGTIGPWGYLGIVPLLTGIVRVCPAYALMGMNTCGVRAGESEGAGKPPRAGR